MISALEHYAYCPRQCALIHIEKVFEENVFTLRGHRLHRNVDIPGSEISGNIRIERALPLVSNQLGIYGKADVVEFNAENTPYPVEYKQGRRKEKVCDDYQVCAQALCLEEMLQTTVPKGAIYYHGSRRRRELVFDADLRERTKALILLTRQMMSQDFLPPPVNDSRCRDCSLHEACLPMTLSQWANKSDYPSIFEPLSETEDAI